MKNLLVAFIALFILSASPMAKAQEKDKDKKESQLKEKKEGDKFKKQQGDKKYKEKDNKEVKYKDNDGKSKSKVKGNGNRGDVAGKSKPRKISGVPPGHYPPAGECRVWYPNKPPGHQPAPVKCESLVGVKLTDGAFILHGDKAYDTEYNWGEQERRQPGSVSPKILDILFPNWKIEPK